MDARKTEDFFATSTQRALSNPRNSLFSSVCSAVSVAHAFFVLVMAIPLSAAQCLSGG